MSFHPAVAASQPMAYHAPAAASVAPPGTFASGTKVQVGKHRVVIERYLSEGGFAHVYLVRIPRADNKHDAAVLKRVAVPDKEALASMRAEVETMKKLKGHRHIVTYIDSHASQLKGGGYEVFLLMEYCSGGGLIDFMNTRLQHRLTEPEILKIFSDVAEGVACMHYLKPPLLHRDLKVENVLISASGSSKTYKLCDFGSAAPPRPAAMTAAEGKLIEDDVQRHTTLQYRSPEMIDVYRKQPIDEKSDIWALGVLLYKLCYYTTPFEEQGQMAILNASFRYPPYPSFSERTKELIASMLQEHPKNRPNIYQVIRNVCSIRGTEVPIRDIYAGRTQSEARRNEQLPSPEHRVLSPPVVGISKVAPVQTVQAIPEVTPMRRGRPTAAGQSTPVAKSSPSPMRPARNDPFAALDSGNVADKAAAADELAARFPSLDEFTLLHDQGSKFQFAPTSPKDAVQDSLNKRVTEVLADEAFARPVTPPRKSPLPSESTSAAASRLLSTQKPSSTEPDLKSASQSQISQTQQPTTQTPQMISTGTMTSPPSSPRNQKHLNVKQRPIYRFPPPESSSHHHRALSLPRSSGNTRAAVAPLNADTVLVPQSPSLDLQHSKTLPTLISPKPSVSSRPSLEGQRPSVHDLSDPINRSKSANSQSRPSDVYVRNNLEYLRDREASRGRISLPVRNRDEAGKLASDVSENSESGPEDVNISSNVEFLRAMEGEDVEKRKHRRSSSGTKRSKHTSLPSISLSNTKNILAGKFGDAFRRFEGNTAGPEQRTPSPPPNHPSGTVLAPVAGSLTTGGLSNDEEAINETEDLAPEVRRELERRRLSQEEKRVAEAAAEYRKRLAAQGDSRVRPGGGGATRASTIQNRVKTLLDESGRSSPVKTAEGYGHFTDGVKAALFKRSEEPEPNLPIVAKDPIVAHPVVPANLTVAKMRQHDHCIPPPTSPASAPPATQRIASRPVAPPKPKALRTGSQRFESQGSASLPPLPVQPSTQTLNNMNGEDLEADFSKRYPSLSGLEMVDADIGTAPRATKIRDV